MSGKRLKSLYAQVDKTKIYSLDEAITLIKTCAKAKFNETIEVAMNLNVDPRKSDQNMRGVVQLPHGTGKTYRVAVFARGTKADEAKQAGADIVGSDDLVEMIEKGQMHFDRCIATPDMMGLVGKVGKILGPRGLMPNPKLGTVTMNVVAAIEAVKGGQVEYRTEKTGIIHSGIGKASFSDAALKENIQLFVDTILKARPSGVKGAFLKKISLSSTMGPGIMISL